MFIFETTTTTTTTRFEHIFEYVVWIGVGRICISVICCVCTKVFAFVLQRTFYKEEVCSLSISKWVIILGEFLINGNIHVCVLLVWQFSVLASVYSQYNHRNHSLHKQLRSSLKKKTLRKLHTCSYYLYT